MADPDLELRGGGGDGLGLLALSAIFPSVISSSFTQNKGGAGPSPRSATATLLAADKFSLIVSLVVFLFFLPLKLQGTFITGFNEKITRQLKCTLRIKILQGSLACQYMFTDEVYTVLLIF